jgi:hypothetical protein
MVLGGGWYGPRRMDTIQVPREHYDWPTYNIKGRWSSYWHQLDEVVATRAETCVEIGVGPGIIRHALAHAGISVTCVDIDPGLGVDRQGDILSLPCSDGEFDVVLCAQVLEHLPWRDVPRAVAEVAAPAGRTRSSRCHRPGSPPHSGSSCHCSAGGRSQLGSRCAGVTRSTASIIGRSAREAQAGGRCAGCCAAASRSSANTRCPSSAITASTCYALSERLRRARAHRHLIRPSPRHRSMRGDACRS